MIEQRNIQNTYAEDFFEVEINETDLFTQNLNEAESAGNSIDDEIFEIGGKPGTQERQQPEQQTGHGTAAPSEKLTTHKV